MATKFEHEFALTLAFLILCIVAFVAAMLKGDDLRCSRLQADPTASDYSVNYYCGSST